MKKTIFLAAVFLVAFLLRVGFIISYDGHKFLKQQFFTSDEYMYEQVAANIQNGRGIQLDDYYLARVSPVYPLCLAAVYSLAGHDIVLVRLLQALLGALTTLIIYAIADAVCGQRPAWLASILSAVYYPFIQMPAYLITEVVYTFLLMVTLLLAVRLVRNPGFFRAAALGTCFGLTILCRGTLLGFFALFAIGLYVAFSICPAARIKYITVTFLCLLLTLLPMIYRNYQIFRVVLPGTNVSGYLLYMGNSEGATGGTGGLYDRGRDFIDVPSDPGMNEYERDQDLKKKAIVYIKYNPGRCLRLAFLKCWNMWRPYHADTRFISKAVMCASYLPIVFFALIGVCFSVRSWKKYLLFYLLFAYYIGVHMILIGIIRYRYPMEPLLIIFGAYGLTEMVSMFCHNRRLCGGSAVSSSDGAA